MRYGSLFTGICGFDLGLDRAGMECAWQVEIDKACQKVEERHYPKVKRYSDVKQVGGYNLEPVDLICGGFPCQDLSIAGRRAGLAGERSSLWFEFHRIIEEIKPGWVVIENVPGLLSSNEGKDFAIILRGLVECGYSVCWRVLDAQYFGLAQRRKRLFIVGSLGDGRSAQVLFESEGGIWDSPPSREKGEGIAGDIEEGVTATLRGFGHGWQGQHNDTNTVIVPYDFFQITAPINRQNRKSGDPVHTLAKDNASYAYIAFGGNNTSGSIDIATACNAKGGTGRSDFESETFITWEPRSQDGTPRFHDDISPTLNTAKGGQRQPMVGIRRLTPTECERLQGFPDGWTDGQADSTRYRQLGNAVAVPVIEWIGKRIIECTLKSPRS